MALTRLDTRLGRILKRGLDVAASVLGLIVLLPLFVVVGLSIKLDSSGPVFFRQTRVGQRGAPFRIWKFRSMAHDAEQTGPGLTIARDGRVTRVGRLLRRSKIDELPQLINVLCGEMSLVGPRPEIPSFVEHYGPDERLVLEHRPGMTDPASIRYRDEEDVLAAESDPVAHYRDVVMRDKIALNLEYQRSATVFSDFVVIGRTIREIFR
jgi:lipopolysaccharide/colanic/teichoic acid biosynthesis glycosyltransferase